MKNCDQNLSGKVGITGKSTGRRHHLHLQQIGDSQETGMNHNEKNGKISSGGKSGRYSLSEPSTFCKNLAHSFFFSKKFACRHWRVSCVRHGVKTAHLVRVTQTHIFFVLCTRDSHAGHIINAHALAHGHVDCSSPRAHQESLVRLMFRRTLLDVRDVPHHLLHSLHC